MEILTGQDSLWGGGGGGSGDVALQWWSGNQVKYSSRYQEWWSGTTRSHIYHNPWLLMFRSTNNCLFTIFKF